MAGENVIYTDMDIDEAINDLFNGFIDEILLSQTITYAAKQLLIKHRETALWPFYKEEMKPTGSEKIIDSPNDFLGTRLHESSFFGR